jgi:hypothetical protein
MFLYVILGLFLSLSDTQFVGGRVLGCRIGHPLGL